MYKWDVVAAADENRNKIWECQKSMQASSSRRMREQGVKTPIVGKAKGIHNPTKGVRGLKWSIEFQKQTSNVARREFVEEKEHNNKIAIPFAFVDKTRPNSVSPDVER